MAELRIADVGLPGFQIRFNKTTSLRSRQSSSRPGPHLAAVVNRARRFCRHAATHSPVARCALPVPHSPISSLTGR
jgi:hypothetical protein